MSSEEGLVRLEDVEDLVLALAEQLSDCGAPYLGQRIMEGLSELPRAPRTAPSDGEGWRSDMENAPHHQDILLYREDARVFFGQYTYCGDWVPDDNPEGYDEDTLWRLDFWAFDHMGAFRLEGDLRPVAWRPLPPPPHKRGQP